VTGNRIKGLLKPNMGSYVCVRRVGESVIVWREDTVRSFEHPRRRVSVRGQNQSHLIRVDHSFVSARGSVCSYVALQATAVG
jgi:hypothetical protein